MANATSERFDIYINFAKGEGDPSRVFHAMGELIDAFSELDQVLLGVLPAPSKAEVVLEDIEAASLKSKLRSVLLDIPDEALRDGEWKKILGHFLIEAKHMVCKWLAENHEVTSLEQIEQLQVDITNAAARTGALFIPAYRPIDKRALLGKIAEVDRAISYLDEQDTVRYESEHGTIHLPHRQHIREDLIRQVLTSETITSDDERIVKVKKPDFLGRSQWIFKYAGHNISASIDDLEWLAKYQGGEIKVTPGDSLRVVMHEEVHYGPNNEVVYVTHRITRVIHVLKNIPPEQQRFFLS